MRSVMSRFYRDTSGATAIEYCFIAGFLSILIVSGATAIGSRLNIKFSLVSNGLN